MGSDRIGLIRGGALALGVFAVILGAGAYLASPAGADWMLHLAHRSLEEAGVQVTFREAHIRPLSGVSLKSLKVKRAGAQPFDLDIPELKLSYSFGVFPLRLKVDEFRVSKPHFYARLETDPRTDQTHSGRESQTRENPFESLKEFLTKPSVEIMVRNFTVDDLSLDLDLAAADSRIQAKLSSIHLQANFSILPGKGEVAVQGQLPAPTSLKGQPRRIFVQSSADGIVNRVDFNPVSEFKVGSKWSLQQGVLSLGVEPSYAKLGVTSLHIRQDSSQSKNTTSKLDLLQLDADRIELGLEAQTNQQENVRLSSKLRTGNLSIPQVSKRPISVEMNLLGDLGRDQSARGLVDFKVISSEPYGNILSKMNWSLKLAMSKESALEGLDANLSLLTTQQKATLQLFSPIELTANIKKSHNVLRYKLGLRSSELGGAAQKVHDLKIDTQGELSNNNQITSDMKLSAIEWGAWESLFNFSVDSQVPGVLISKGITQLKPVSLGSIFKGELKLHDSIVVNHRVVLEDKKKHAEFDVSVSSFDIPQWAKGDGLSLKAIVDQNSEKVDARISFQQKLMQIYPDLFFSRLISTPGRRSRKSPVPIQVLREVPPLKEIHFECQLSLLRQDEFRFHSCKSGMNGKTFEAKVDGSGRLSQKNALFNGQITVEVPEELPIWVGTQFWGKVDIPWRLSLTQGREIDLESDVRLIDFGLENEDGYVEGVTGAFAVREKLVFDGKKLGFRKLISQNPFERVDYEGLKPLIDGAQSLRVNEIGFEEKTYGPLIGYFSLNQNIAFAHQFDFSVGSSGRLRGAMYFDGHPSHLQLGLMTRMTGVDLEQVIPERYKGKSPGKNKRLSARSGIVLNLNTSGVDGRVDVNEIGGEQLIAMINTLDPTYQNEKMNRARTALTLGYPTSVQLAFQNGYMDLGMDLQVLGLKQRIDVRGIPTFGHLSSITEGWLSKFRNQVLD